MDSSLKKSGRFNLTDEQKDAVIEQAINVCQRNGWIQTRRPGAGANDVRLLKEMIEKFSGKFLMEYT
jgi:hypothetical protein